MGEFKIHSGTRVKLRPVSENAKLNEFCNQFADFATTETSIEAAFLFLLQKADESPQLSMVVALSKPRSGEQVEDFLSIVDKIQPTLPESVSVNLYRFGASEFLDQYCITELEPVYLRKKSWLKRQLKATNRTQ